MNEIVSLKNIVVDFDGEPVLTGLSLDIHDKEFVTAARRRRFGSLVGLCSLSRAMFFLMGRTSPICRRISGR